MDAEAECFDMHAGRGMLLPDTRAAWWKILEASLQAARARAADVG